MFHMLDQCYTISHKLCPKKITKHTNKSTKCQQQSKSVNSIMFYSAILFMLIIASAISQEMNGQNYETSGSSSFVSTNEISEDCAPAAMSRCTDPLKVVTDNRDLGFATSMDELQEMCPKLMEGLRCIDDFTVRCLDREHRAYFNTLYAGTTQVIVDLCQEGSYQSDYLRHAPCMRQVQSGYERCASEYQHRIKSLNSGAGEHVQGRSEEYADYEDYEYEYEEDGSKRRRRRKRQAPTVHNGHDYESHEMEGHVEDGEESVQLLCCSFQKYLHCSESVVNTTCGYETARFTKSFLDRMSGPLIQGHCQAYEYGSEGCRMTTGGDPWDEYNQGYQQPQFSSATKLYSTLNFNIMSFSSIITVCKSAIIPFTLSFILHAI